MTLEGLLVKAIGGFYYVETADGEIYECRARGIFRKRETTPLVGDRVKIEPEPQLKGTVVSILPRKNEILRPPMANLDQLFVVTSVCDPQPNLLVLDKFLAMSEYKDIEPVVIVTKTDLEDATALVEKYRHAGFRVFPVSNERADFAEEAKALLAGRISAFTGNTGVGKSSFLNVLYPEFAIKTAHTSQKLGRGRHTTRHVELYKLPDIDAYVADTPGFSSMDLMQYDVIRKEELQHCFREFEPFVEHCRFTGCSHTVEKGCAVLEALQDGGVEPTRHESYCALYQDAKQIKEWELKR